MQRTVTASVHGGLYLALQRLRGRPVHRFMRQLEAWERLPKEEFTRRMERRLAATLERARREVRLYSSGRWEEALGDADPRDLRAWPVLERQDVLSGYEALRSRGPGLLDVPRRSSATTGGAVRVAMHPHTAAWQWAWEYHVMRQHGVPLGIPTLVLWGGKEKPFQDRVRNRTFFSATELTEETLEAVAEAALSGRYPVLWTYPSAAFQLARHLSAGGGIPRPPFRYVKVGGEPLFPFQREEIEGRLGERLVNFYGANEVGPIAAECPAGTLHVVSENVHLEILHGDARAPVGEIGDLVLTPLTNPLMPLVRYRIGDRASLAAHDCVCGWPRPVLGEVEGRRVDRFRVADGSEAHASVLLDGLTDIIRRAPASALRQVAFRPDGDGRWTVLAEGARGGDAAVGEELRRLVREHAGPDAEVAVRWTRLIPREPSGKFKYFRAPPDTHRARDDRAATGVLAGRAPYGESPTEPAAGRANGRPTAAGRPGPRRSRRAWRRP